VKLTPKIVLTDTCGGQGNARATAAPGPTSTDLDRIAWESWTAHGRNATRAAREMDCTTAQLRTMVKRHQARATAEQVTP
jgi:hypothetical protein